MHKRSGAKIKQGLSEMRAVFENPGLKFAKGGSSSSSSQAPPGPPPVPPKGPPGDHYHEETPQGGQYQGGQSYAPQYPAGPPTPPPPPPPPQDNHQYHVVAADHGTHYQSTIPNQADDHQSWEGHQAPRGEERVWLPDGAAQGDYMHPNNMEATPIIRMNTHSQTHHNPPMCTVRIILPQPTHVYCTYHNQNPPMCTVRIIIKCLLYSQPQQMCTVRIII